MLKAYKPRGPAPRFAVIKGRPYYDGKPLARRRGGGWIYRSAARTFSATILPDGSISLKDGAPVRWKGLGVAFDLTDAVMRARGRKPYAADMLVFTRDTRSWRLGLRRRAQERRRLAALAEVARLAARCRIVGDTGRDRLRQRLSSRLTAIAPGRAGVAMRRALKDALSGCRPAARRSRFRNAPFVPSRGSR